MENISFKSRINFVNTRTFENFRKGTYIDFRAEQMLTMFDKFVMGFAKDSKQENVKNIRLDVLKADEFYTDTVRTCTAGGVIDTENGEAVGLHVYDSLKSLQQADDILDSIFANIKNPDRALLIGSKNLKMSEYSLPIFQKIYEEIMKRVKNVTIFREHIFPYSESNIHYSLKDDTWTINSMYRMPTDIKELDVLSSEDLYKCYKEIKIADGDTVEFLTK